MTINWILPSSMGLNFNPFAIKIPSLDKFLTYNNSWNVPIMPSRGGYLGSMPLFNFSDSLSAALPVPRLTMPSMPRLSSSSSSSRLTSSPTPRLSVPRLTGCCAPSISSVRISSNNQNMSYWQSLGYNSQKGSLLANETASHAVGFSGYCARYVKNAIVRSGLGRYESGHAYQQIDTLRHNSNFREISPEGVDVNSLPAGCILVFGRGVSGYSREYGHIEVTTGTGKGVSDGVTNHLKKPSAIFMPV